MAVYAPGKVHKDKLNWNQRLWRYLDLPKFMEMIEHKNLFFTQADKFEDRYEGAFTSSLKSTIVNNYNQHNLDGSYDEFKTKLRERAADQSIRRFATLHSVLPVS